MQEKIKTAKDKIIKLLRWSEKYTKTDLVYLASNGFWVMLAQGVSLFSAFLVTMLLTNILPKEVFGQYRFILAIIPLLAIFTLPGTGHALTRAVACGTQVDLRTIAQVKIKWGLLGSLGSLMIALYYFIQGNNLLAYTFTISALFIPFFETFFIYSFYYQGHLDFKTPAIYESLSRLLQALIMILTALLTHSIIALVISFFIGQTITRYFFYYITCQKNTVMPRNESTSYNKIVSQGKKLSATTFIGITVENIDKLIVWHFLGATALATYTVLLLLPTQIAKTLSLGGQVLFPKFANMSLSEISLRSFSWKLGMIGILLSLGMIPVFILITLIFPHLFSSFTNELPILYYALPLIALIPLRNILFYFLISQNKQTFVNKVLLSALLSYILAAFLITQSLFMAILLLLFKESILFILAIYYSVICITKST